MPPQEVVVPAKHDSVLRLDSVRKLDDGRRCSDEHHYRCPDEQAPGRTGRRRYGRGGGTLVRRPPRRNNHGRTNITMPSAHKAKEPSFWERTEATPKRINDSMEADVARVEMT